MRKKQVERRSQVQVPVHFFILFPSHTPGQLLREVLVKMSMSESYEIPQIGKVRVVQLLFDVLTTTSLKHPDGYNQCNAASSRLVLFHAFVKTLYRAFGAKSTLNIQYYISKC